jgi:hypothetical protein
VKLFEGGIMDSVNELVIKELINDIRDTGKKELPLIAEEMLKEGALSCIIWGSLTFLLMLNPLLVYALSTYIDRDVIKVLYGCSMLLSVIFMIAVVANIHELITIKKLPRAFIINKLLSRNS